MGEDVHLSAEVEDLMMEIDRFRKEKEQVRNIVGRVGGVPAFNTAAFNAVFAVAIAAMLAVSLVSGEGLLRLLMIELAVTLVSLKVMFLMHRQARVSQFQLWILSSIEWRLDQIMREIKAQKG
jgi:hypothetical protein